MLPWGTKAVLNTLHSVKRYRAAGDYLCCVAAVRCSHAIPTTQSNSELQCKVVQKTLYRTVKYLTVCIYLFKGKVPFLEIGSLLVSELEPVVAVAIAKVGFL